MKCFREKIIKEDLIIWDECIYYCNKISITYSIVLYIIKENGHPSFTSE